MQQGSAAKLSQGCRPPLAAAAHGTRRDLDSVSPAHMEQWQQLVRTQVGLSRRYTRVGSVVMLLHDPSDIFLEGAKLADYAGLDGPAAALFAGLVVSWAVLRLGLLPFWVIRSCMCALPLTLRFPRACHQHPSAAVMTFRCVVAVTHFAGAPLASPLPCACMHGLHHASNDCSVSS